ncbi:hypothetical protein [Gluconobacter cerinus]|uniref:p22 tail accessory factor n=1 Tax=Gluconobacter cerinus TaxID=38307 RepID=A0A1B6VP93_9PROT|nr:hypothetical protein [Gluconobacter cerinus]OAJ69040.1 P22 tail accessory factor [Gluconobacter cerinus]
MSGTTSDGTPEANTGYLVSDLVGLALRQIGFEGLGTNPSTADLADGVMHLNMLLAKWQQQRFLVPNLVDLPLISTGASIYYLGPGGDFDAPQRPARLDGAYVRLTTGGGFQPSSLGEFAPTQFDPSEFDTGSDGLASGAAAGPLDFPLSVIHSYEEYASIGLKGLRTWPSAVYYNPAFPLGELRFFPIPQASMWELHVLVKQQLPNNLKANDPINLPQEYWDLIMWTLAVRMAPSYGQEASPTVAAMAKSAFSAIRAANQQTPRVQMPAAVAPNGCAAVNPWWIYTGGF